MCESLVAKKSQIFPNSDVFAGHKFAFLENAMLYNNIKAKR